MKTDHYKKIEELYDSLGRGFHKNINQSTFPTRPDFIKALSKNAKILEVGTAGVRDIKEFTKAGFKVTTIDISKKSLANAKKLFPKGIFKKMDTRKLTFPDNSFDGIWASAVLLHILKKDIPKTLSGFYRVLKPEGMVGISVKKGKGKKKVIEKLSQGKERTFIYFEEDELREFLKNAGFKNIKTQVLQDQLKRKGLKWVYAEAEK